MALVPVIQPPIMKALTTEHERQIKMEQLRVVSQREDPVPDRCNYSSSSASAVCSSAGWYADAGQPVQGMRQNWQTG